MARWRRRSALPAAAVAAAAAAAVAVGWAVAAAAAAAPAGDLTDLIKAKQRATVALAVAAREALTGPRRCELLATCAPAGAANCSVAACAWTFGPGVLSCTGRAANPVNGCGNDGGGCTGIKLSMNASFVRVAAGTELSVANGLVPLDVYTQICQLRALDPLFVAQAADTVPWAYIGTSTGMHRTYPGQRQQYTPDGECEPYDPRLRPWYASAASGPLDVAIVVDRSAGMGTRRTPAGRPVLDAAIAAVAGLLGTLDWSSYVGVVRYNDEADTLLSRRVLERADAGNVATLQREVAGLRPEGGVDLAAALGRAYDLLSRSSADPAGSSARCTRVLFLVTGTEDDCYARECGPASPGPCTCTSSILAAVRAKQASLAADNAEPVNLIVLSFGGVTDELGRQLTCGGAGAAAQGLWVPISDDGGNLITAMAPAYRWLSTARRGVDLLPESVFFSEKYQDNSGYGEMTTAAMPFYDAAGALLGVAGVDIPFSEIAARSATPDDEITTLSGQGTCTRLRLSSCEQQALRGAGGVCAERLPHDTAGCFVPPPAAAAAAPGADGGPAVWVPVLAPADALPAAAAAAACAGLTPAGDGRLATARTPAEATALAGVLGEDPTWIGLSRPSADAAYAWALGGDGDALPLAYSSGWPRGAPPSAAAGNCVVGDRRGVTANWVAAACGVKAAYVCELPLAAVVGANASSPAVCGGGVHRIGGGDAAAAAARVNPPPAACAAAATPRPCAEPSARQRRPFCALGAPGDQCEDRCCAGCECTVRAAGAGAPGGGDGGGGGGSGLGGGAIAGIVVGGLVGLIVAAALVAAAGWFAAPWVRRCCGGGVAGGGAGGVLAGEPEKESSVGPSPEGSRAGDDAAAGLAAWEEPAAEAAYVPEALGAGAGGYERGGVEPGSGGYSRPHLPLR